MKKEEIIKVNPKYIYFIICISIIFWVLVITGSILQSKKDAKVFFKLEIKPTLVTGEFGYTRGGIYYNESNPVGRSVQ